MLGSYVTQKQCLTLCSLVNCTDHEDTRLFFFQLDLSKHFLLESFDASRKCIMVNHLLTIGTPHCQEIPVFEKSIVQDDTTSLIVLRFTFLHVKNCQVHSVNSQHDLDFTRFEGKLAAPSTEEETSGNIVFEVKFRSLVELLI